MKSRRPKPSPPESVVVREDPIEALGGFFLLALLFGLTFFV